MTDTDPKFDALPDGEYALIELLGHRTLVGRIEEVERFGTKMLCVQPLFRGELQSPVLHGGASIYCLTPISKTAAFERCPDQEYQLPAGVRMNLPPELLGHDEESY